MEHLAASLHSESTSDEQQALLTLLVRVMILWLRDRVV